MAGIEEYLDKIKHAVYGREVRQAIHDGIETCYKEGKAGATDLIARNRINTVNDSLSNRIDELVVPSGGAPSAAEVTDARIGADGITYASLGQSVREQVSGTQDLVKSSLVYSKEVAVGDGYKRLYFGKPTIDKILKVNGTLDNGTGSGNNWVFEDFVAIPKGTIYFACADNYAYNFVFYDENKNVVDTINSPSTTKAMFGKTYENTLASYIRAGCYRNGGIQGTETCFVYVYDDVNAQNATDVIVPFYRNVVIYPPDVTTETASKTRMLSDFIYADAPLLIWSQDTSLVTFGVHLYDAEKNYIKTYYANSVKDYVSVPSGHYLKVYLANVSGNIYASKEIAECVKVQRKHDNIGFLSFADGNRNLTSVNERVGLIDPVYADKDIVIECEDFDNYTYNLALYSSKDGGLPELMEYAYQPLNKSFIPKGTYYRCVAGPREGVATLEDFSKIKITEINENNPEVGALASSLGKIKYEMDTDVVPSYYEAHMNEKVTTIANLAESSALQFAFITDYHYGTYRQTHNARPLLTKLVTETPLDIVVNGGDTWTSGHSILEYKEAKRRLMNGIIETTPNAPCNWFFVLGNHETGLDYRNVDGQTQTFGPYFTTEEFQSIMGGNVTGFDVICDPNSTDLAYYFDKDDIRVVVINNSLENVGSSELMIYVREFLSKALLSMGNKTAVIISHEYFDPYTGEPYSTAVQIANIIEAYNGRSTNALGNWSADFRNCTGEVACWVVGHAHMDRDFTLDDGTKVISTTTCNSGAELGGLDRTVGTINENAFDVYSVDTTNRTIKVTRIGAGSDREFTY